MRNQYDSPSGPGLDLNEISNQQVSLGYSPTMKKHTKHKEYTSSARFKGNA